VSISLLTNGFHNSRFPIPNSFSILKTMELTHVQTAVLEAHYLDPQLDTPINHAAQMD